MKKKQCDCKTDAALTCNDICEGVLEKAATDYMNNLLIPYPIIEKAFKEGWKQAVTYMQNK